ncbi:MAG TPA: hypothetical protein VG326_20005 [Tepidisphaeraceae bacterium]|nr:hypothetical protein [Tepidisphaeraceae bacterium]
MILRLGWAFSRPTSSSALQSLPDQIEYLSLAQNLLHGNGLSFIDPRFSDRVYAFRAPGYPLFLAACGANARAARAVQAMVDTSTILAVFLIARRIAPKARGLPFIAAVIAACNPLLVYFCGLLLSETIFVAMLTWGMLLVYTGFSDWRPGGRNRSASRAKAVPWLGLIGGIVLALSVLVRPSAAGLPVALGIGAVVANRQEGLAYQSFPRPRPIARRIITVGATTTILVVVVLTPWALRNLGALHHLIWTDTNAGFTLYDGYNANATGASDQSFVKEMPGLRQMDEISRSNYLEQRAMGFAVAHPRRVVELIIAKAVRTWSPVPLSAQFGGSVYRTALLCYSAPFDLLVLWGLWKGSPSRSTKTFLLLPAIYLTVVHALTVGSLRYRVPAEPALAVLAACAIRGDNRTSCRDFA